MPRSAEGKRPGEEPEAHGRRSRRSEARRGGGLPAAGAAGGAASARSGSGRCSRTSPATTTSNGSLHGPGEAVDDVVDERIVEERRPFARRVGVELDAGEVAAAGADPPGEVPGAEADVEDGKARRRGRRSCERRTSCEEPGISFHGYRERGSSPVYLTPSSTCAIGMRRPLPNAFVETFSPGAACCRLYSARSICRAMPATSASGAPASRATAAGGLVPFDESLEDAVEELVRAAASPGRSGPGRSSAEGAFSSVEAGMSSRPARRFRCRASA